MSNRQSFRLRLLAAFVAIYTLVLFCRLFYLQVVKTQYYRDTADRQYMRPATGIFNRGTIYFSNQDGSLTAAATVREGYTIALNPKLISSASSTFNKLLAAAGTSTVFDPDVFWAKAAKTDDPYEEILTRAGQDLGQAVAGLKAREIIVSKDRWRYYPASSSASHVIGLLGYKGNDYIGRYGLEKEYDDILSRRGEATFTNYFAEIYRGLNSATATGRAEGDLVLSIELKVQNFLETSLAKVMEKYSAETVGGIVIDPRTGEIYAMAARPNFHPGERQSDLAVLPNPLVEGRYEMGSIIKALTMAAGLDAGAVKPGTTYNDPGCMTLNTKKICNYDGKARGVVSMQEVLNQSLNTGATFVETKIGKQKFKQYFEAFGLAEKTGIDLPGEIVGSLSTLKNDQDVEFATASFGQGISLTPIETVRALSTLANGGYLIRPHVVKEIRYVTGLKSAVPAGLGRQVLSTSTSAEISRMLAQVVDVKLANGKAKLPHTSISAKTGTAQYVDPTTREYYPDRYLHSFFGYFPSPSPRFLVFLYVKHPQGVQYASETLTVPFLDITKFLINYYNIPPDR